MKKYRESGLPYRKRERLWGICSGPKWVERGVDLQISRESVEVWFNEEKEEEKWYETVMSCVSGSLYFVVGHHKGFGSG